MSILFSALILSLVINFIMFIFAYKLKSDKLTDISYAISFIAIVLWELVHQKVSNPYSLVLIFLVIIWALRIGIFLLIRVLHKGKDSRFDNMRDNFTAFGRFWLGQALTAWILLIPCLLTLNHKGKFNLLAITALIIWAGGLLVEAFADAQKYIFTNNPINKNHWIASGLWRYSRHPNYFGEILVWIAIYLYSLTALPGLDKLYGLISPLFIIILLLFVSGIPILEKSADKRWGELKDYKSYKKHTSLLIPFTKLKN